MIYGKKNWISRFWSKYIAKSKKNKITSEIYKKKRVSEMKKKDLDESIKNKVKKEFEDKIDVKCKVFVTQTKQILGI